MSGQLPNLDCDSLRRFVNIMPSGVYMVRGRNLTQCENINALVEEEEKRGRFTQFYMRHAILINPHTRRRSSLDYIPKMDCETFRKLAADLPTGSYFIDGDLSRCETILPTRNIRVTQMEERRHQMIDIVPGDGYFRYRPYPLAEAFRTMPE